MKISLEAEVFPLFAAGVALVLVMEMVFTLLCFRKTPGAMRAMAGRLVCIAISFLCLGAMLFWRRLTPDGDVCNSSGLFALFGIFWFFSECCTLVLLSRGRPSEQATQKTAPQQDARIEEAP